MKFLNRIKKKLKKIRYISKSKKISKFLYKILGNKKIYIVDIGAGHRFLPTLLNFDGVSKIAMVDPNDNLDLAHKNFLEAGLYHPMQYQRLHFPKKFFFLPSIILPFEPHLSYHSEIM